MLWIHHPASCSRARECQVPSLISQRRCVWTLPECSRQQSRTSTYSLLLCRELTKICGGDLIRSQVILGGSEGPTAWTLKQLWCLIACIQKDSALVQLLDSRTPEVRRRGCKHGTLGMYVSMYLSKMDCSIVHICSSYE